jgi:tetratricopeptide (TPR) repeat protein
VFLAQNMSGGHPDPAAYLKVASQYPNTSAGARAALLAGGAYFIDSKFSEAHAEFSRFIRDHRDHPLLPEALLGIAACLDAQGKTDEAITAYKSLIDHHPDAKGVLPQAKFALARLYEQQKKIELARNLYEDVGRSDPGSSLGNEAGMRFEELKIKYPLATAAAPIPVIPAKTNVLKLTNMAPAAASKP